MKLEEYGPLVEALLPAVLAAGRIEMRHFAAGVEVETKADTTPVTIADHEAEEVLTEGLHRAAPGIPVIAEEAMAAGRVPATGDAFFLVDPLDGTRAFIKGSPEFTINIGLIADRKPVFGIIYAPALGQFFATLGPRESVEAQISVDAKGIDSANARRRAWQRARQIRRRSSLSPAARTHRRPPTNSCSACPSRRSAGRAHR